MDERLFCSTANIESISIDVSNNVCATGYFTGTCDFDGTSGTDNYTSTGIDDVFITSYYADGNYRWTKTVGGSNIRNDIGASIVIGSNGTVYVFGIFGGVVYFDPGAVTGNKTSSDYDAFITPRILQVHIFDKSFKWRTGSSRISSPQYSYSTLIGIDTQDHDAQQLLSAKRSVTIEEPCDMVTEKRCLYK